MPSPIVHFEIMGGQGKELQDFYANLLGWSIDANNEWNYGMTTTGEGSLAGGIGGDESGASRVSIYAKVDDLQAYLDKAEKLGGKTVMPPTEIPGAVTMAMYADPAGNVMGLIKG